jgi:O-antigen ligase
MSLTRTNRKEKIYFYLVLLFLFTIPISSFLSTRILIVTLAFSLFLRVTFSNIFRQAWSIALYLGVLLIGLLYSTDKVAGLRLLETSFSLFCIPIIFTRIRGLDEKIVERIFYAFCAGLLFAGLLSIGYAAGRYVQFGDPQVFYFYQLTDLLGFHPTYMAYHLILALTYCTYSLYHRQGSVHPGWLIVVILFFFGLLLLTGGHTAFIGFLLVCAYFVMRFFTDKNNTYTRVGFAVVLVMVISLFIVSSTGRVDRNEVLSDDGWDRYILWESAVRATPGIFGVGTGDYRQAIQEYYVAQNLDEFAGEAYNAHNQFIQILFSNGIPGVLALIILLIHPLYVVYKDQHVIGLLTLFPFIIYSVTEVFLGRYQGVVLFAVVHQLWLTYHYSGKISMKMKLGGVKGQASLKHVIPT